MFLSTVPTNFHSAALHCLDFLQNTRISVKSRPRSQKRHLAQQRVIWEHSQTTGQDTCRLTSDIYSGRPITKDWIDWQEASVSIGSSKQHYTAVQRNGQTIYGTLYATNAGERKWLQRYGRQQFTGSDRVNDSRCVRVVCTACEQHYITRIDNAR